jgi:hypothetical protein
MGAGHNDDFVYAKTFFVDQNNNDINAKIIQSKSPKKSLCRSAVLSCKTLFYLMEIFVIKIN